MVAVRSPNSKHAATASFDCGCKDMEPKRAEISIKSCFSLSKILRLFSINLRLSSKSFFDSALTAWDSSLSCRHRITVWESSSKSSLVSFIGREGRNRQAHHTLVSLKGYFVELTRKTAEIGHLLTGLSAKGNGFVKPWTRRFIFYRLFPVLLAASIG